MIRVDLGEGFVYLAIVPIREPVNEPVKKRPQVRLYDGPDYSDG
jgi:hypothetical protein